MHRRGGSHPEPKMMVRRSSYTTTIVWLGALWVSVFAEHFIVKELVSNKKAQLHLAKLSSLKCHNLFGQSIGQSNLG